MVKARIKVRVKRRYGQGFALIVDPQVADKRFTTFTRMGKTPVFMGYDAPYALFVHEDMPRGVDKTYTTPGTGPKFLYNAVVETRRQMRAAWRDTVREYKKGLEGYDPQPYMEPAAREAAAWVAMNRSLELVPVDTGSLKNSHYVEVGAGKYAQGGSREGTTVETFIDYE